MILFVFFVLAGRAKAANWYLNTSCPNNGDGSGPACASSAGQTGAWKSADSLNASTYSSGDDIYLRDGVTVTVGKRITPNVQGTVSNQSVIGSYYNDSGAAGKPAGGAVLNGNSVFPSNNESYQAMVHFSDKSYLTVKDLKIINSGYYGIRMDGGTGNKIENNYIEYAFDNGIVVGKGAICSTNFEVDSNTVKSTNLRRPVTGTWGSAIAVAGSNSATPCPAGSGGVVKNNILQDNRGEGIDIIKGVVDTIVEDNIVISSQSANIYFDRNIRRSTIRRNLVYGYTGSPWGCSGGISIDDESTASYAGSQGNKVHSNMVVNCHHGFGFGTSHPGSVFKDNKIFNNTFIDNGHTQYSKANFSGYDDSVPFENSHIKNNISWLTSSPLRGTNAAHAVVPSSHQGLNFASNLWSGNQVDQDARSASDPGNPTYPALSITSYLQKTTGWNTVTAGSLSGQEFNLKSTAANSIDKGEWLTAITSTSGSGTIIALADQYFSVGDIVQIQGRTPRATVTQVNGLNVTVNSPLTWNQGNGIALAYSGTRPDIGAREYSGGGDTQAPGSPSGLSVR